MNDFTNEKADTGSLSLFPAPKAVLNLAPSIDLMAAFLSGRTSRTLLVHRQDMEAFQVFPQAPPSRRQQPSSSPGVSGPSNGWTSGLYVTKNPAPQSVKKVPPIPQRGV